MKKCVLYTVLPGLALLALTLLTYGEIRHYFFTDVDTFSLINDGQYHSFKEALLHFNSELMSGRMVNAAYYRPLTSLAFGTEYALFGLNPEGYQLFGLSLFFLSAFFLFKIAQHVWGEKRGTVIGFLAATLFIIHPLQIDTVPATARLGDIIFVFFFLLGFLALLGFISAKNSLARTFFYGTALLAACAAFFAKEPAVLTPFIYALTLFVFSSEEALSKKLRSAIMRSIPFFTALGAFLAWRGHVVKGIGGYINGKGLFTAFKFSSFRAKVTILGHLQGLFFSSRTDYFDRYVMLLFEKNYIIYPLFIAAMALLILRLLPSAKRLLRQPEPGVADNEMTDTKMAWIFGTLIFLQFWLMFCTQFSLRYLYFSLVGFSILLALASDKIFHRLREKRPAYLELFFVALLIITAYAQSPLWNKARLRRWQTSGNVAETVLTDLEKIVARGEEREIFLVNVPYSLTYGPVSAVFCEMPFNQILLDHAIKDYLALKGFQGNGTSPEIVPLSYLFLTAPPEELRSHVEFASSESLLISIKNGGVPGDFPWTDIPGRKIVSDLFHIEGGRIRFEKEPANGWSKSMTITLSPRVFELPAHAFYTYNGRALERLKEPPAKTVADITPPLSRVSRY